MSKLSEYSKFDHMDYDHDDEDNKADNDYRIIRDSQTRYERVSVLEQSDPVPTKSNHHTTHPTNPQEKISSTNGSVLAQTTSLKPTSITKEGSEKGRYVFEYNGRKIYEWEQSLEDVILYIPTPPGKKAHDFVVDIQPSNLKVGLKGMNQLFINERFFSKVDKKESSWYLDQDTGNLVLVFIKACRGELWEAALIGSGNRNLTYKDSSKLVDPITLEKMRQSMMLERFQEEQPGFDFRDATFNGPVPDPRTFMGGISYR